MQRKQLGFAAQGAVILLLVVAVVVGAGYVVLKKQNKEKDSAATSSQAVETKKPAIAVDGTPKSAAAEISDQVSKEIKTEDDSTDEETASAKVDDATIKEAENSVYEKNL